MREQKDDGLLSLTRGTARIFVIFLIYLLIVVFILSCHFYWIYLIFAVCLRNMST